MSGGVVRSTEKVDADREVGVPDGVGHEAQTQHAGVLQRPRHEQWPGIQRAQPEAFDERRDVCLRLRVVPGDEHVQQLTFDGTHGQHVGKLGVECLDDIRIGRGGLGDLQRAETVFRCQEAREVGFDGVGDVDKKLARQLFAELLQHVENGGVGNRQDDDVPGRGGAEGSRRCTGSDLSGQCPRLGRIATHYLDEVSGPGGKTADRRRHAAGADDADSAHVQFPYG